MLEKLRGAELDIVVCVRKLIEGYNNNLLAVLGLLGCVLGALAALAAALECLVAAGCTGVHRSTVAMGTAHRG